MIARSILGVVMMMVALASCFFIAGNLDPFSWDPGGRAITVFVAFATFALTVTYPYLEAKK